MKYQERKDNRKIKKIFFIIMLIIVIIAIIIGINFIINKNKEKYTIDEISSDDIKYYRITSNGLSGVIDRNGNVIVKPEYNTVKIPNPKEPIFVCLFDYNPSTGEYKTKVLNDKNEELLTDYESVNTIEIKEIISSIPYEKTVLQYKKDGKYGIIDFNGKEITKPIYEEIRNMPYREGELIVKKDGKYGVININGGKLLDFKYDYITGDNYYSKEKEYSLDGYIVGINNSEGKMQYGYLDSKRNELLDINFDRIYRMNNVEDDENIYIIAEKESKIQLYKNNKLLLDNDYQAIKYNEDSKLLILQKDNKYGVTDLNGKQILNTEYDQIQIPGNYIIASKSGNMETYNISGEKQENSLYSNIINTSNENYKITVDYNNKYGVMTKDEQPIIPNQYNFIQYLYDNYFIVGSENGQAGIINDKAEIVVPIEYEIIQKLENSDIVQAVHNDVLELYNKQMEKIVEMQDGKLDIQADYVKIYSDTETQFVGIDGTLKTDFEIFPDNNLFASKKDGKWGFVDKNNNVKIDYVYDKVTELNELGFAGIKLNGKWGVIDKNGNIVLEPVYEIPEQNGEPYFIGKYYKVISGYEEEYFTDEIEE